MMATWSVPYSDTKALFRMGSMATRAGSGPTATVLSTALVTPFMIDTVPLPELATYTRFVTSFTATPFGREPTGMVFTSP